VIFHDWRFLLLTVLVWVIAQVVIGFLLGTAIHKMGDGE